MVLLLIGSDNNKSSSLQLNINGPALYIPPLLLIGILKKQVLFAQIIQLMFQMNLMQLYMIETILLK